MELSKNSYRLRFYIGEEQKFETTPLFVAIVEEAHRRKICGATVLRGMLGYGANSRIRSSQILRLSDDLPIIVEVVDSKENLLSLFEYFDESVGKGLVTLEPIHVLTYRHEI